MNSLRRKDTSKKREHQGFTLIELLIVVAIIAILALIAVPNFLEAQTRSKVSRGKADMRTMATALEAYAVDHNAFPQCHRWGVVTWPGTGNNVPILERLSTPIAYISNVVVKDPFTIRYRISEPLASQFNPSARIDVPPGDHVARLNSYIYQAWCSYGRAQTEPDSYEGNDKTGRAWLLHSAGPDATYHNLGGVLANDRNVADTIGLIYDPTNGTVSFGSIYRVGGMANPSGSGGSYAAGAGLVQAVLSQK